MDQPTSGRLANRRARMPAILPGGVSRRLGVAAGSTRPWQRQTVPRSAPRARRGRVRRHSCLASAKKQVRCHRCLADTGRSPLPSRGPIDTAGQDLRPAPSGKWLLAVRPLPSARLPVAQPLRAKRAEGRPATRAGPGPSLGRPCGDPARPRDDAASVKSPNAVSAASVASRICRADPNPIRYGSATGSSRI